MVSAVLDSNQFIFGFRKKKQACVEVLKSMGNFECFIPSVILTEVVRQLKRLEGRNFASLSRYTLLRNAKVIDESTMPSDLIQKYKEFGLKEADAGIAAFTEFVKADIIISENRHFLKELKDKPFKVVCAEEFIKSVS